MAKFKECKEKGCFPFEDNKQLRAFPRLNLSDKDMINLKWTDLDFKANEIVLKKEGSWTPKGSLGKIADSRSNIYRK